MIWEVDPAKGSFQVLKLYVTDAYHQGTLRTTQVGAFTYDIPSSVNDDCIIVFINIILMMGWV